jgi:hypothetical protein
MGVLGSRWDMFYLTEQNHENLNEGNRLRELKIISESPEYEERLSAETKLPLLPSFLLRFHL